MFSLFHLGNIFCRTVDEIVGAGIDTLMSISDGLGPSIFCRKMEKAGPMREEMDEKVVYFPPESALIPLMFYFSTVLFPICTLTWREELPRLFFIYSLFPNTKTVNLQFDSAIKKTINY